MTEERVPAPRARQLRFEEARPSFGNSFVEAYFACKRAIEKCGGREKIVSVLTHSVHSVLSGHAENATRVMAAITSQNNTGLRFPGIFAHHDESLIIALREEIENDAQGFRRTLESFGYTNDDIASFERSIAETGSLSQLSQDLKATFAERRETFKQSFLNDGTPEFNAEIITRFVFDEEIEDNNTAIDGFINSYVKVLRLMHLHAAFSTLVDEARGELEAHKGQGRKA